MENSGNNIISFIDSFNIFIAVLNVLITIILTLVNYKFLSISKKKDIYLDAYSNFYLPIQIKIVDLIILEQQYSAQKLNAVLFKTNSEVNNNEKVRKLYLSMCDDFLLFYDSLEKRSLNKKIDKELLKMISHMKFIVMTKENRLSYENYEQFSSKYPMPCYSELYKLIENLGDNKYIKT